MQKTRVWSLIWEDTLEVEMATHSNILVWEISWTEEPGGLQSMGFRSIEHGWATDHAHTIIDPVLLLSDHISYIWGDFLKLKILLSHKTIKSFVASKLIF